MNAMLSDYRVKRNILSYIQKSSGQIIVRVRWNKVEVSFFIGFYGEPEKWDLANKMALRGTIHEVNGKKYSGAEINKTLNAYLSAIDKVFRGFEIAGEMPSKDDVRTGVNRLLGRGKANDEAEAERKKKTVLSRFGDFIKYAGKSNNWQEACYTKYNAIRENLKVFDPELTFEDLTYEKLTLLRDWYVMNNYRNRTINKNFAFIKGFLIWAGKQGYLVHKDTLEYKTNLKVVPKPVSFLSFSELMDFYRFSFPENRKSLERARDMFAFMCFTSLRISDLRNLKRSDLRNGKLYVVTQKTADPLVIDLNEYAREIIDKYSGVELENNALLPVATGQKLNKYLQEGAELAGLNKEWTTMLVKKGGRRYTDFSK